MPLRIDNSAESRRGVYDVNRSYQSLLKAIEKLSSGLKINRASDDPAGLVISEQMRSQIASLNQEIENTTMMISKYNTADATIGQLRSVAQGIRTMAIEAANGSFNNQAAYDAYQAATDRAVANFNHIIETADFNNTNLLNGGAGALTEMPPLPQVDLSNAEQAVVSLQQIDESLAAINQAQVDIGATQKHELETRRSHLEVAAENLTAAESEIRDTDYALAMVELIKSEVQLRAGIAMMAHSHVTHRAVLSLLGD
jgi:flagellin